MARATRKEKQPKPNANTTRKQPKPKGTKYEIHDNGGVPFFVFVDGKQVTVLKNMDTFKMVDGKFVDVKADPKQLFAVKAEEVLFGKESPKGNSILIRIGSKYRYIGHEIYDFTPVKGDTIVSYSSKVGNNDVPYPYAVGKTHVYILLDKVAVEKTYFDRKEDIYQQYYYEHRIHMCLKGNPKTDLCKDKEVYKPRIEEFKKKLVKLATKQIQKRGF